MPSGSMRWRRASSENPPRGPSVLHLKDSLSYRSCSLTFSLGLPLYLVFFYPSGMNVCFILWFDIKERRKKKSKPVCCNRCISPKKCCKTVPQSRWQEVVCLLVFDELLSFLTCKVCIIRASKSQTGLSSLEFIHEWNDTVQRNEKNESQKLISQMNQTQSGSHRQWSHCALMD